MGDVIEISRQPSKRTRWRRVLCALRAALDAVLDHRRARIELREDRTGRRVTTISDDEAV